MHFAETNHTPQRFHRRTSKAISHLDVRGTCAQLRQGLSELTLKLGRETGKIRRNSQLCLMKWQFRQPLETGQKSVDAASRVTAMPLRLGGNDSKGLRSKSISGYMDGLKHFASDLDDVPHIAGAAVIARMLVGQVKLGKRPNPRKIGITVDLLREMVVEVECMDELRPVGKALLKAIFVIAHFGAFRIDLRIPDF